MPNDRSYNHGITIGACIWCSAEYVIGCSRAQEQSIFCSKKCELEARFWLVEVLRGVDGMPRRDTERDRKPRPPL